MTTPSLRAACEAVLRGNDRGHYTVPAPHLYPHQWAWDSAFAAIGWAYIDPARAWRELRTLLDAQWEDGRVPHIVFHEPSDAYFPGPEFWEVERSSSITQPPFWAIAARRVVEISGLPRGLEPLVERIERSHRFFYEHRDPLGWDLVAVAHPWESGMDNLPAWDEPLSRVDVSNPPRFERKDRHIDPALRPTDDQYLRYAVLVKAIAQSGFAQGPFAVYDPFMSAVLARAEGDLEWLAQQVGVATSAGDRSLRIRQALKYHLWSEEAGRFFYYDAQERQALSSDVLGCYAPLWSGTDPAAAAKLEAGMRERYRAPWPLPSTTPVDPGHEAKRYWRGPCWVNLNWMFVDVLGPALAERTVEMVQGGGFREYFHCQTGEGLGADSFTWTAALALDLSAT